MNYLIVGPLAFHFGTRQNRNRSREPFQSHPRPTWLVRGAVPFVSGWSKLRGTTPVLNHEALDVLGQSPKVDTKRAKEKLGYTARPLAQTIEDSYRFFADQGLVDLPEKKG